MKIITYIDVKEFFVMTCDSGASRKVVPCALSKWSGSMCKIINL